MSSSNSASTSCLILESLVTSSSFSFNSSWALLSSSCNFATACSFTSAIALPHCRVVGEGGWIVFFVEHASSFSLKFWNQEPNECIYVPKTRLNVKLKNLWVLMKKCTWVSFEDNDIFEKVLQQLIFVESLIESLSLIKISASTSSNAIDNGFIQWFWFSKSFCSVSFNLARMSQDFESFLSSIVDEFQYCNRTLWSFPVYTSEGAALVELELKIWLLKTNVPWCKNNMH